MIRLFYNIKSILPIFIFIFSMVAIFYSIYLKKSMYWGYIISILSIFFSILTVLYLRNLISEYCSDLIKVDQYSYFSIFILLISSFYTCIFSHPWFLFKTQRSIEFYFFIFLSTIGGIIVSISFHFFTLFLGIELLFLPLLGILMFFPKSKKNLLSLMVYMILSIFSSTLLLLGFSFIYFVSGRLCFSYFSYFFIFNPSLMLGSIMLSGIGILCLSLFFKLSLFPLHTWSPGIYENVNSCSLIYFSTVTKIAILSFLMHLFLYVPFLFQTSSLYFIIKFFALASVIFGSIAAIIQTNIQKIIGYLSISNLGILILIILTFSYSNSLLLTKLLSIYLFNYVLSIIGFFSIKSIVDLSFFSQNNCFITTDNSLIGLFWIDPVLGITMTIILFSLSGFPITLGFWGKFFFLRYLIQKNFFFTVLVIITSGIIGTQSYLFVLRSLYFKKIQNEQINKKFNFCITQLQKILIVCIGLILVILGLFPKVIFNFF
ncbi:NADH-quinone oxidoreductase subunit N [Buchnera aphidicola]|uniref:NADH-quinone oxidoreductase subunit N n=1 Tax=Buchnera aphidicola (Cinara strobi) TaxID=1921549 RepID=A0A3B1DVU4_9GAMM|nr:proton-conducting transporter membrane subunit [Buchnera aphidicola]VAX76393.1 NADH-quinone oxidoreductase subunit N [Buchnera aphidicola (Cinara strobi)]